MKIGLYLASELDSININNNESVKGDEIIANSIAKSLEKIEYIEFAKVYGKNNKPKEKLDVMIYLNKMKIEYELAKKHICYIQNSFNYRNEKEYCKAYNVDEFDGLIVFSKKLYKYLKGRKKRVIYLPFGIDIEKYKPQEYDPNFDFDVAYIGNDIKGYSRTKRYILPACKYNFGLWGSWGIKNRDKIKTIVKRKNIDLYDLLFLIKNYIILKKNRQVTRLSEISKGKISFDDMIKVLSSSKILINCTLGDSVKFDVINYRILEILACRGFVITDEVDVVKKEFKKYVVFTKGNKDLENKIKYYLNHPEKRKKMAKEGYEYVIKNYNYDIKAKELYDFLLKVITIGEVN